MLVAIPLFRDEVSPRFGYATEVAVATVDSGEVGEIKRFAIPGRGGRQVLSLLVSLNPEVIICGGIHGSWQVMLNHHGISIFWGVIGRFEDVFSSFAAGKLENNQFVCSGRSNGKKRRRCGKMGNKKKNT